MLFGIDSLYFWLAVIIISIAAEAATLGLCGIWFAAGGAAALVAATFGASIWMQLVIFVLLSAVMLLLVRPLFSRFLKAGRQATNADRIIGQSAVVTEPIDNLAETGAVRVLGKEWTARTKDGTPVPAGARVTILEIRGVKAIVQKIETNGEKEESMPLFFIGPLIWIVLLILLIAFIASNIVIVPQARAYVIERLGTYRDTWNTGLHFKVPLFERIARKVTLKEQVVDFPPQPVITKDNVTMQIDTVVYFQITDPKMFTYGIESPMAAIENLTATTLRNIIGDLELDQTLTSRDIINTKMRAILDEATDAWGIKVNRVELKNIIPPAAIQESMEKQMKAERERREAILVAEGKKQSAILVAEGEKEAAVLAAEATRLSKIKEAQGEAEALLAVQKALADSIALLNDAAPSEQVIRLKSLEAFGKAADGKATKIIIPSEIQSLAGLASSFKEVMTEPKESK